MGTVLASDVMEPGDQRGGEIRREWLPRGLGQCWWTTQDYEGREEHRAYGHMEVGRREEEKREGEVVNTQQLRDRNRECHTVKLRY